MSARFCSQCGTRTPPGAKFCAECGSDLRTGAPRGAVAAMPEGAWRITTPGVSVLGLLLVAGLAIWASILSPEPPRAKLGGGPSPSAGAGQAAGGAGAEAPGHPPMELPAEVKTFLTDLATKAQAAPDDTGTWNRLGQVYYRAAQVDPSYYAKALEAYDHVLARNPKSVDAIRGKANVYYDKQDHAQAIPLYEQLLATEPDNPSTLTDLATMYLYSGDPPKAIKMYEDVIAKNPSFLQAYYNLGVTHAQLGHTDEALAAFKKARELATDDDVKKQLDDMVARLSGNAPPPAAQAAAPATNEPRTPFQTAVEKSFRAAPIMGERIARFEWTGPTTGKVVIPNFPMGSMPPEVRGKFTARLQDELRSAIKSTETTGVVKLDLTDAGGTVMATITPDGAPSGQPAATAPATNEPRTPFQTAVEKSFKAAPIMGERIARFEWTGPTTGKVVVPNFPMDGMPPEVRGKFTSRLQDELRSAIKSTETTGDVKLDLTDAGGTVMATITP